MNFYASRNFITKSAFQEEVGQSEKAVGSWSFLVAQECTIYEGKTVVLVAFSSNFSRCVETRGRCSPPT